MSTTIIVLYKNSVPNGDATSSEKEKVSEIYNKPYKPYRFIQSGMINRETFRLQKILNSEFNIL